MILTGKEIEREVERKRIVIDPFDPTFVEPNSYGFHLGRELLVYRDSIIDAYYQKNVEKIIIPESGYVLKPRRFYLGHTVERMGSQHYASELYARLSTSLCGIFIQTSCPLGHVGAIIPWTLELLVAHKVKVYPGMLIGKICFWKNQGNIVHYAGRYRASQSVLHSLLSKEQL